MPFRTHPELAKLFRDLPAATCAACLLAPTCNHKDGNLIETLEQLAAQAGYVTHDTCAVCKTYKACDSSCLVHPLSIPTAPSWRNAPKHIEQES